MAKAPGRALHMDVALLRELRFPVLPQEIGKLTVPDANRRKPASLTKGERQVLRLRPLEGEKTLGPLKRFGRVLICIRPHHQRWDGAG